MTTLVKIHRKGQMTLPSSFRAAMGVGEGSLVELSLKNGKAVITPQMVIDRSKFSNADDEYTPAQRRVINASLAEAEKAPITARSRMAPKSRLFSRRPSASSGRSN